MNRKIIIRKLLPLFTFIAVYTTLNLDIWGKNLAICIAYYFIAENFLKHLTSEI